MVIQAPTADPPAGSTQRNADGTIDYHERIILAPQTAAGLVTMAGARPGAPSAAVPSRAEGLPRRHANLVLVALQALVGYAWLASGVDKLLYGSFPNHLGELTTGALAGGRIPDIFAQVLQTIVLPNAAVFGVLVEGGETLTGVGLLAGAVVTLAGPLLERDRSRAATRTFVPLLRVCTALIMGAALGGVFLGLNFYVLDGMPTLWFTPGIAYGGAIHSSLLLALACLVILMGQIGSRVRLPNRFADGRELRSGRARFQ